jgi:hypothetical protein
MVSVDGRSVGGIHGARTARGAGEWCGVWGGIGPLTAGPHAAEREGETDHRDVCQHGADWIR